MLKRQLEDAKTIQDLRITSVQKDQKKQRVAQLTPMSKLSKQEKVLRALRKKLNSINELIELEKSGVELDAQQLQKVASLESVMQDMSSIMERDTSSRTQRSDADEEDDDE